MNANHIPGPMLTPQYYGNVRDWKESTVLRVRSGENLAGLDFHMTSQEPHAIRGRVTGVPDPDSLSMTDESESGSVDVVDEDGDPLNSCFVRTLPTKHLQRMEGASGTAQA
jgi:hypothetical protein